MSCIACDEAQGTTRSGNVGVPRSYTFVRVGRANVLVSGCEEHIGELIHKIRIPKNEAK